MFRVKSCWILTYFHIKMGKISPSHLMSWQCSWFHLLMLLKYSSRFSSSVRSSLHSLSLSLWCSQLSIPYSIVITFLQWNFFSFSQAVVFNDKNFFGFDAANKQHDKESETKKKKKHENRISSEYTKICIKSINFSFVLSVSSHRFWLYRVKSIGWRFFPFSF